MELDANRVQHCLPHKRGNIDPNHYHAPLYGEGEDRRSRLVDPDQGGSILPGDDAIETVDTGNHFCATE